MKKIIVITLCSLFSINLLATELLKGKAKPINLKEAVSKKAAPKKNLNKSPKKNNRKLAYIIEDLETSSQNNDLKFLILNCENYNDVELLPYLDAVLKTKEQNPNQASYFQDTLVHFAAENCSANILSSLIESGGEVNAIGDDNLPPLFRSISSQNYENTKVLLEKNADPNFSVTGEKSPNLLFRAIELASSYGDTSIIELLIEFKVDLSIGGEHYSNALEFSKLINKESEVTKLIKAEMGK